jgi:hypothetical protein
MASTAAPPHTRVATPLWFVSDGHRLFALTDLHSAKVRRVRRNSQVLVASCRVGGKLRSEPVPARASAWAKDPRRSQTIRGLLFTILTPRARPLGVGGGGAGAGRRHALVAPPCRAEGLCDVCLER